MAKEMPHVALLIETSRTYGRDLLRGVKRYISEHRPWSVYMELRALDSKVPPWLKHWRGDGILTRTGSQAMADAVRETGVPAIELRATRLKHDLPFIGADNRAMGRMVAEHLIERGFRRFGVYEIDIEGYFEERRDNFIETLRQAGYPCSIFQAPGHRERPAEWEKHQDHLASWVAGLEKPVGLLACTDQLGFWLLDACNRAGVAVPEEAAVVGAENEESLCTMSTPPLSSVLFNGARIGYEAAAALDRMMAGGPAPQEPILVPPIGIVTRQSSDVVAVEDHDLAEALRFIREHAHEGITVEDVLRRVAMSRSALERRMREAIGRTPKSEILRVQINLVRQLLVDTDLTLAGIAHKAGFRHPQYMAEVFKQKLGQTPGEYRAAVRL
ncbi:MAG: XylR family transcriptional regulator [Planctomycetes bacterium]|nr:XylR family transcriptional regulator [Planctomycetota bacterium]